ncbi:MAG: Tim44/TimA family putative adaptor protein [Kiloniellales bacterium]|nr:Tim44/TimA family putative adaptor protein [Kiloniellales bacterium]
MQESIPLLELIFLVAVAAFFILKLRSVLGKRTGHEKRPKYDPFQQRNGEEAEDKVVPLPQRDKGQARAKDAVAGKDKDDEEADDVAGGSLAAKLTQIKLADESFTAKEFLSGAKLAFEMIVAAFASGDKQALKPLLSKEVFENFCQAIDDRESRDETLETTLVGITDAEIIDASLEQKTAYVVVKFVSEQVNVTRDTEERIVDGDPNHVAKITDLWTFARPTRSRDPNWQLVATDTPN